MKKIIIANWKSNPGSAEEAVELASSVERGYVKSNVEVVIAPPSPFFLPISKILKKVKLGAQDVFWEDLGPYTGEVSVSQLKRLKVKYVIIGHSERRRLLKETDEMINKKILACLKNDLTPVLCVGEPWEIRKRGLKAAQNFVAEQLQKDLKGIKSLVISRKLLVIAYEPVWAIGTGKSDKPNETIQMVLFIKKLLASRFKLLDSRVLYGGSVNSKNAHSFLSQKEIDGALVGGASLDVRNFSEILKSIT